MDDETKLRDLIDARKHWQETCFEPALKKKPERKAQFTTDIGLDVAPLYTPADLEATHFNYKTDAGFPGQYPFVRGPSPAMYRSEPWLVGCYSGFGEAEACNGRFKKLLEWGVDKIEVAVDLPTQVGYDSDHLMARGEVGRVGVAIDTLRDMEILFDGIPLNSLKCTGILAMSYGPIALALLIALGEKQGLETSDYVVELQNDFLEDFVARGTYIFPIRPSVRLTTDVVGYCARHARHWSPLYLHANHFNASGSGSTKATAFAMANGVCYLNTLVEKGYTIDEVAPLIGMFLDERADFFVAVCHFRAARKVWARIMKEKMKAHDPQSMALRIAAHSHGGETLLEPLNNIARITLGTLAYVFGGVQILTASAYDEPLGTPSEEAAKVAVRTQQIIADELGITNTIDPLGGSYFIEHLTGRIEGDIYDEFLKVEAMGGAIAAIENGYFMKAVKEGGYRRQREFDDGSRISIGVNKFRTESKASIRAFRIDPAIEQKQIERLNRVKKERNNGAVDEALDRVRRTARGEGNLVPPILDAVRAYASVGEICGVLKEVFGEYQAMERFS